MQAQMGNGHGKGHKSVERKKKPPAKESSSLDGDVNGDLQQANDGERLFLEEQAKRKDLLKNIRQLNIKSKQTVSDVENPRPKNPSGSSSMSSDHDINEHNNGIVQGDNSCTSHNDTSQDGLRSKTHDREEPDGTVNDIQSHSQLPLSTAHLPGSESNRVSFDTAPGGPPAGNNMPLNHPDLSNDNASESIFPWLHRDVPPSRPSHIMNGSFPVHEPGPNASNVSERVPEEGHNNVQPVDHDVHVEPGVPPNHAIENDSNRGPECSSTDVQRRAITTGILNLPDHTDARPCVMATALRDDQRNNSEEKSSKKAIPQEQTEYVSDVALDQPISLTPKAKIESSTPSGMQIVPGLTGNSSVSKEKVTREEAESMTVANQLIAEAVTNNIILLEKLSKHLDRESRIIKCWKHLAYVLKVPAEETRKFDLHTEHSPTEDLFNYLGDIWRTDLRVGELKVKLRGIHRNDIIESLNRGGFRDEMLVSDLMSGYPAFISLLSPKLDIESRTIGNWRALATQFGIRKQMTEQFGLRGSGPTGALFSYMRTTEGVRDLKMGELCKHFKGMGRNDLVNLLKKYKYEETDTRLVATEVVDGSELFTEIGERLNKDIRAVKNWRNLAYRLNIPHEVYDVFDTSKAAAKSSTKMLFEWLAQWKPNLSVSDLLTGLKEIDRFDVVDLVTKETRLALENIKNKEADSRHGINDYIDGATHQSTAVKVFSDLRQMHHDADKLHKKVDYLLFDLEKNAFQKGFLISNNQGEGNCMFYALAEQLKLKKGIAISHINLRRQLVRYLHEHPKQQDGTDLFHFVNGYPSWPDYLEKMNEEGTWGDHLILFATANCLGCVVRVVSSLPDCADIIIRPCGPVDDAVQLVLGHVLEEHYVSLRPCEPAHDVAAVSRGELQAPPASCYSYQNLQTSRYGEPPQLMLQSQGQHPPMGYQQPQHHHLPQAYQQPLDRKFRYSSCDKNVVAVKDLPYPVYNKVCLKLNIRRDFFDDFRMVAETLGMDRDTTEYAGQDRNPSHTIFSQYYPTVTVRKLIQILHRIERMDVAEILEEWIAEA